MAEAEKKVVKVSVGDGIYMEFYGDNPWGVYIDTDRWLECVGDFDDPLAKSLQAQYDAINGREEFRYAYDYDVTNAFFAEIPNVTPRGPDYGDVRDYDPGELRWWNTYNGECDVFSTMEMLTFRACEPSDDPEFPADPAYGEDYIMFRVHRGGDVRGNYDSPRIARLYEFGEQYDVRVSVDLPPLDRDDRSQEWDTFTLYEFDEWCKAQDVALDLDSVRAGAPVLSNGRTVLFSCPPMMNG